MDAAYRRDITEQLCRILESEKDAVFVIHMNAVSPQQYEAIKALWNALSLAFTPAKDIKFTVK